jgi:hypothetical protein
MEHITVTGDYGATIGAGELRLLVAPKNTLSAQHMDKISPWSSA